MPETVTEQTLNEMISYYRARAQEYDEWFERKGRFDRGPELNKRWFAEVKEVEAALQGLHLQGDVLELAPGTGIWTRQLLPNASSLIAVDASEEMLAINRARLASERIAYMQADLFNWQPERAYDAVFFGFWISHVPVERIASFTQMVAAALKPGGKLFFVDSRYEPTSTAADHTLPEQSAQVMTRKLNDGRAFQIVKNFYDPALLTENFARAGVEVTVRETPTYFIYGGGHKPI